MLLLLSLYGIICIGFGYLCFVLWALKARNWSQTENFTKSNRKCQFSAVIIGAGVSGICVAYYLKKKRIPFVILEKESQLGGTWFTQRFPGIRFDSLHVQTLFSFEPLLCQPMCDGKVFLQYLQNVVKKYGIYEYIQFEKAVSKVNWSPSSKTWSIWTKTGEIFNANFVINCNGYYDSENPHLPKEFINAPFKGEIIHSMKVDQDKYDWSGKKVIVIGSGASACTAIPIIAKQADQVVMVQRSPSYCIQANYGQYPGYSTVVKLFHKGIHWPWYIYRLCACAMAHASVMFMAHVLPSKWFRALHRWQLMQFSRLSEKEIDEHFSPKYGFAEQRPLISIGFIESLKKNVDIRTTKIKGITEKGITVENNEEICADVIMAATGFNLEYFKFTVEVDSKPVNMYNQVLRRDVFFEQIPNFFQVVLFARLDSKNYTCFTPLVEHIAVLLSVIIEQMEDLRYKSVLIRPLYEKKQPMKRYVPLQTGYFTRNLDKCFKALPAEATSLGKIWNIAFGYPYKESDFVYSR